MMLFLRCMFNTYHDVTYFRKNTVKEQINVEMSLLGATTHKF